MARLYARESSSTSYKRPKKRAFCKNEPSVICSDRVLLESHLSRRVPLSLADAKEAILTGLLSSRPEIIMSRRWRHRQIAVSAVREFWSKLVLRLEKVSRFCR